MSNIQLKLIYNFNKFIFDILEYEISFIFKQYLMELL